jgi:structural maintenance of chromosome 1
MGRLKQLELDNFKSYAGKQIVGPFDDFTCIIGPNGAGKSNMMDAISFVLGVASRHLRSANLKELIFRKDLSSAPARGGASVKLIYEASEDEIEGRGAGEITFMRRITPSGVCTYRIDGNEVTFEEYEEVLESSGGLVKSRNIHVFHGDVESTASKSPADLTKMFEQICGSDQLKKEYEELLAKKTEVEEKHIGVSQKRKLFAGEKREVKQQKDEADEFQEKLVELGELKTTLVLWQIFRNVKSLEDHQRSRQLLKEKLDAADERLDQVDIEIEAEKQKHSKLTKSVANAEKDYNSKKKAFESIAPQIEAIDIKLKTLRKRSADITKNETAYQSDKTAQTNSIAEITAEINAIEKQENSLRASIGELDSRSVQLDANKLEEYSRLRQQVAAQTSTAKAELDTLSLDLASKQSQLQRIENQNDSTNKESASEQRLISEYTDRVNKLRQAMEGSTHEIGTLQSDKEKCFQEMNANLMLLRNQEQELAQTVSWLSEFGDERKRSKQEERMMEAINTMQSMFSGVHGKLSDLCNPIQKKYATAISVASGRKMDAIVVDTMQVASECMKYLRDHPNGSSHFLPQDNIYSDENLERYRKFGDRYKVCFDLVECKEEKFRPAVLYAVTNTLVCDTLEIAQDLAFNKGELVKIVTLKGHVINRTGAMTGGYMPPEGATNRWGEREVETKRTRKAELEESIARLRQATSNRQLLTDYEMKIKLLQSRIQYNEADLTVVNEKMAQINQQIALKQNLLTAKENEKRQLNTAITTLNARIGQLQTTLRTVEAQVFRAFSESVGVSNIREFEDSSLKKHQELSKKRRALSDRRATLEAQLEYEKKKDFDSLLARTKQQLRDVAREIEQQEDDKKSLADKEVAAKKSMQAASKEMATATQARDEHSKNSKKIQQKKIEIVEEKEGIEKKISGDEMMFSRIRQQLHEVLQRAQVEEIALPTIPSRPDKSRGQSSSSGATSTSSEFESSEEDWLAWSGSRSRGRRSQEESEGDGSEPSSRNSSRESESTHFSQSDNEIVRRYFHAC